MANVDQLKMDTGVASIKAAQTIAARVVLDIASISLGTTKHFIERTHG